MHLLVLSAFQPCCAGFMRLLGPEILPQCTFWCSVLSDHPRPTKQQAGAPPPVSMHLLVLSAFRLHLRLPLVPSRLRLNAPSGAQCFPTAWSCRPSTTWLCRLNAPSGAQRFPTIKDTSLRDVKTRLNAPSGAQCFPTRLWKSMPFATRSLNAPSGAQCFPTATKPEE